MLKVADKKKKYFPVLNEYINLLDVKQLSVFKESIILLFKKKGELEAKVNSCSEEYGIKT